MRADFVLIEGYRDYRGTLPSIVFGRSADQVQQLKTSSTRAFSGILPDPQQCEQACGLPFVPLDADQSLVADLVEQHAAPTG
jgi:molybdopterin-guanine dinucleotide biosynthesis protein